VTVDYNLAVGSGREPTEIFASLIVNVQLKVKVAIQTKDMKAQSSIFELHDNKSKLQYGIQNNYPSFNYSTTKNQPCSNWTTLTSYRSLSY